MKTFSISIAKSRIFFDVDALTHNYARATQGQSLQRADAVESDTGDTTNESLVTRFAERRAAELEGLLSRFLTTVTLENNNTESPGRTGDSFTYNFYVEDAFQSELLESLADSMQAYISYGAAADWYMSVGDAQGAVYTQLLPAKQQEIISILVKRKFPSRI